MLETALIESGGRAPMRKPATVVMSICLHVIVIVVLILIPVTAPQALPAFSAGVGLPLPVVAKTAPPKPKMGVPAPSLQPHTRVAPGDLITPTSIPSDIALVNDVSDPAVPMMAGSPEGIGSILRGLPERQDTATTVDPPPPPPPMETPKAVAPIRVGGNVQQANLIHQVVPKYPNLAKVAHVQGVVTLEATIDKEGSVRDLRVITGHPLLIEAALNAVQQWKYKPTILNGDPIEVITTVTVTFALQ